MPHFDRVPDESAWHGYQNDFGVRYLHERFFGKSHEQVQEYFGDGSSISRMDELMFAPRPVFRYYVQSFAMYVLSPAAAGDSATASAFLSLLEARQDAVSVEEIYPLVAKCVDFIATHQEHFDAPVHIYGNFKERCASIAQANGA